MNESADTNPTAVWDGSHVGVAYLQWMSGSIRGWNEVRFALLNPDGTVVSDVAITNYATIDTWERKGAVTSPQLTWNGNEYAISWLESNGAAQVSFIRLDASGTPKGPLVNVGTAAMLATSGQLQYQGLAWSDSYHGYAVAFGSLNSLVFRRLGVDATDMEAPYTQIDTQFFDWQPQLLAAPDGTWGFVQAACGVVRFITFGENGRPIPPNTTLANVGCYGGRWPALVRGGDDWITSWIGSDSNQVNINRGSTSNLPKVLTKGGLMTRFGDVNLAMAGPTLALAWTEEDPAASRQYRYRLQRFRLPTVITEALTPIHGIVEILPSRNIGDTEDVSLVATGNNSLLAVWSDNRWSTARELYAAPIDLKSCP